MGSGWPTLVVISLLLVGLHPFTYTSLATSFDGLLHLYRLVELDHLIAQGIFFPRWAPDFVFGFGYPIFNFYAPLAYYLSAPLHELGLSFVDSATVFFVACTLAAGLAMYALANSMFDDFSAGIVAAVAYTYAPTHIYDNFYRSAWGTVLAYAITPFCLWAMWQWYCTARTKYLWMLTLSVAALMLAHNVSALLALPVIVVAAIVFGLDERLAVNSEQLTVSSQHNALLTAHCLLFTAFGLALSAFFWLPALVEAQYIQAWRLTIPPDFDFHTHFLSLANWIAWPAPAEVGRINPDLVNTVGPVHVLLAAGGIATTIVGVIRGQKAESTKQNPAHRLLPSAHCLLPTAYFALVLLAALAMTLPQSAWLWERIALLPSLQFPHRFLGLVALCVALLSAAWTALLPARWRVPASVAACTLLIIFAIPFLYPRPLPPINPNPTLADVLAHEHQTGALGTTAGGEYFPTWVQFIPKSSTFEEAIVNGENPQRFDSHSLPLGAKILSQHAGPLSFDLQIDSPTDYRATFRQFYFPGWQGSVDGQPVETAPSAGQGFAAFTVPPGDHRIALTFTSTPIRDIALTLSIFALAVSIVFVLLYVVGRRGTSHNIADQAIHSDKLLPCIVLGLVLFLFKIGIADRIDTPLRATFDGERVPQVQYARSVGLGSAIVWLGYDLSSDSVLPEQALSVTLYWQAQRSLDTVYSSFVHLIDEQANLYAQKDNLHPGGAPTTTWRPREYDVDRHVIEIPAGTPPGDYRLEIGLYDPNSGTRLPRESAGAGEPADRILLGPVHIRKSSQPPALDALQMKQPLARQWPSGLSLLGLSLERDRLPADDFLRVALYWRNDARPLQSGGEVGGGGGLPAISMNLRLIDPQGKEVASQQGEPSNNHYPTTLWSAGEIVRDNRALMIAGALPNGAYRLQMRLDGDAQWSELTEVSRQ